ncbi:unnamed protein product [Miscanthus lutarioriparius]|uniref:Uncharacterized protein n=1 Tax=Miscanthus lutarioriparius TaxID=422564 RepID=A0A811PIX4_9POAL|nr:unnamed protein product [Miscanthus lutarioriparius]
MEVVSAFHGALGPLLGKLTALLADECGRLKGVRREIRSLKSELTSMQAAVQKYSTLQDPDFQAKAWISLVRELAYDTEDVIDKFIHQLGDGGHQSRSGFKGYSSRLFVVSRRSEETHLVGIDGPRDHLVTWMMEEENSSAKHRRVLSIVGFGGLGKTTLAKEVCHKIQGHFDCHAFVSVSQQSVKKIMKDVISQVPCKKDFIEDIDIWDEKKFIGKLRELLQDKRYLIVIDDIWSIAAWDTIKCAFPENKFSSRIIATTRIVDVARSCCLGGLPLAIISISSLLANKPSLKDEWEKVRRSIGSALDKNRSLEGMNSILCLSYNDLPPNLKTCLIYLSIFPEDYVIERETLVRRWIAEGFISEERGLSKQEVAENHFYELINKSMVQPVDVGYDDNLISVVGHGQTDLVNRNGAIRRLSVQHIDQQLVSVLENQDLSHVRSLRVITSSCIKHLPSLVKFETLRVLDFEGCQGLEEYDMNEIPSGIVRLYDLETLDLTSTYIKVLPSRIVQLTKLQYLLGTFHSFASLDGHIKIPDGIGNMSNLRVITGFNITKSSLGAAAELGNLTSLNELHLQLDGRGSEKYKRHEEMLLFSLCKLSSCKLQSLSIVSRDPTPLQFLDSWSPLPSSLQRFQMTTNYYLPKIPNWITPALASVAYLNINLEERLTIRGHGFPCLKELYIYRNSRAINLLFEEGALPKLEKLDLPFLVSWAKSNGFYLGISHLPCLKHATITLVAYGCASSSENRAAAAAIRNEANATPMIRG